jgi:hypothetical protein
MQECIICRKQKTDFSDEHVIPDSIGGYYHIYNVCVTCNSKLGNAVDSKLINHKFIEFQRHLLKLKGKKGNIPNPFSGIHQMDGDFQQKVRLEYNNGVFEPYLIPNINDENILDSGFSIIIDKRDENKIKQITEKILSRHGIPIEKVKTEKWIENESRPCIRVKYFVDIKNFKIGLLKIAYEFAVNTLPAYYKDSKALKISKILEYGKVEELDKIKFLGSGFDKEILEPFSHFFDFNNPQKHYLILISLQGIGLICFVNLFNAISIGIILTNKVEYLKDNNFIVGINDIENRKFEIKKINEVVSSIFSPLQYRFQYFFPEFGNEFQMFLNNQKLSNFGYYYLNNKLPFFDKQGNIIYQNIDDKLKQEQLPKIPKGDDRNEVITQIFLDEELYIKVLPSLQLCNVVSVQIEQYRERKI